MATGMELRRFEEVRMLRTPFNATPPAEALIAATYSRYSSELQRDASIADQQHDLSARRIATAGRPDRPSRIPP